MAHVQYLQVARGEWKDSVAHFLYRNITCHKTLISIHRSVPCLGQSKLFSTSQKYLDSNTSQIFWLIKLGYGSTLNLAELLAHTL